MTSTTVPSETIDHSAKDRIIRLGDGRVLGYAEYGDPSGSPLMFFHGFPGSRLAGALFHDAACRLGARLIAPDRPGMGLSDFQAGRKVGDWASDVAELANALSLDRFAVLGVSSGGPYAAACAALLPARVTAAGIASGYAPPDAPTTGMDPKLRILSGLGKRFPGLQKMFLAQAEKSLRKDPEQFIAQASASLPAPDKAVYARPDLRKALTDDALEAFRKGAAGPAWDAVAQDRAWGFRLSDIAVPVFLWQGEQDANVPRAMGEYQARLIPGCTPTFYENEGHISTFVNHAEEILRTLLA